MRIYFARHGESVANTLHVVSNRGLIHPLTRTGREQARSIAEGLRDARIGHIFTSPLLRAVETSIIVANSLDIEYEITGALREYDCGIIEGRSDDEAWSLWKELHDAWVEEHRFSFRLSGGESFSDLQARFVPFIEGLITDSPTEDTNVLCVSHGGLYRMMLPLVLTNVDGSRRSELDFDYSACIVTEPAPGGLRCIRWNDREL